jgi:hypothetical protein
MRRCLAPCGTLVCLRRCLEQQKTPAAWPSGGQLSVIAGARISRGRHSLTVAIWRRRAAFRDGISSQAGKAVGSAGIAATFVIRLTVATRPIHCKLHMTLAHWVDGV